MDNKRYIVWIDGLKGAFALIVVLCHLKMAFLPIIVDDMWIYRFPFSECSTGGLAVSAFICLSTIVMVLKCRNEARWQTILIKRYFRLAVPIIPVILLYVILCKAGLFYNNQLLEELGYGIPTAQVGLTSFLKVILTTPFGGGSSWLGILWMLPYIFATPFVVVLLELATKGLTHEKRIVILLFCCLLAAIMKPLVISIFASYGIAKYLMPDNTAEMVKRRWIWLLVLPVLYVGVHYMPFFESGHDVLKGIIIVLFVALAPLCQKVFSIYPLVWLGGISFDIYLLHLFVIYSVACRMYLQISYFPHRLMVIYGSTLVLTVLFAWFWSKVVNRPINKVLKSKNLNKYIS